MSTRTTPNLHATVLAAGASSRFGSPKQLVRFNGQPLLLRVLSSASEVVGSAISIVLGANAAEIAGILPSGRASVLLNRQWEEGIASSVRTAVKALPGTCDGLLILLADQPLIAATTLTSLASAWKRQPLQIIASRYSGIVGVPAIFPRWCFSELCELRGDQGARALIIRHTDRVVAAAHPEAAVDIDRPEDLLGLNQ